MLLALLSITFFAAKSHRERMKKPAPAALAIADGAGAGQMSPVVEPPLDVALHAPAVSIDSYVE